MDRLFLQEINIRSLTKLISNIATRWLYFLVVVKHRCDTMLASILVTYQVNLSLNLFCQVDMKILLPIFCTALKYILAFVSTHLIYQVTNLYFIVYHSEIINVNKINFARYILR